MNHGLKYTALGLSAVLVLIVTGLLIAPQFIDWNQYKAEIEKQASSFTGFDVRIGEGISLSVLPMPYVSLQDVRVKNNAFEDHAYPARFSRLDVHVDPWPLLQGQVRIASVRFVEPVIDLQKDASGSMNWQTPQIEALLTANVTQMRVETAPSGFADRITLDSFEVVDGVFRYSDANAQSQTSLTNINLDIAATTLLGPFNISGDFKVLDEVIEFSSDIGRVNLAEKSLSMNLQSQVPGYHADMTFAGVLDWTAAPEAQGEFKFEAQRLADIIGQPSFGWPEKYDELILSSLMTLNTSGAKMDNAALSFGEASFHGGFEFAFDPLALRGSLVTNDRIGLDAFMQKGGSTNVSLDPVTVLSSSQALLADVDLPLGEFKVTTPGFDYRGHEFDGLSVVYNADKAHRSVLVRIEDMPGQSALDATYALKGQKEGVNASVSFDLKSLDVSGLVSALSSVATQSLQSDLKDIRARGNVVVEPQVFKLETLRLDTAGTSANLSGTLKESKDAQMLIDATFGASNIIPLFQALGVDLSAMPPSLKTVKLDAQFEGTPQSLQVTMNLEGLESKLIAAGPIFQPFSAPHFGAATIQLQHPNTAQLIQAISPGFNVYRSWQEPLNVFAVLNADGKQYTFQELKGVFAGTPVEGSAALDIAASPMTIDADISAGDLVLIGAPVSGASKTARWSRETIDLSGLRSINGSFDLVASSLTMGGWRLNEPIVKMQILGGGLQLEQFDATIYGGRISAAGSLKPADDAKSALRSDIKLRDVAIEDLMRSFVGVPLISGEGRVNLDSAIQTSGASVADLVETLGGSGAMTGQGIILKGIDLTRFARALSTETRPGDTLSGLWGAASKGGQTVFEKMDGEFTIENGIINLSGLAMDGPAVHLETKGNVNLPDWTMQTDHMITMKGESALPPYTIALKGPLDNPAQSFGQGALQDYLSRKLNRKLQNVIQDKLGLPRAGSGGEQSEGSSQERKPEDAIKGILRGILQ